MPENIRDEPDGKPNARRNSPKYGRQREYRPHANQTHFAEITDRIEGFSSYFGDHFDMSMNFLVFPVCRAP